MEAFRDLFREMARLCQRVPPIAKDYDKEPALQSRFCGLWRNAAMGMSVMNKGLYALAGVIFALVVSAIIGPFFSGLALGLVIGYSISDKGELLTSVWAKLHPYIDLAFARLMQLVGSGVEEPSNPRVTNLKDASPTTRRKRTG